ncbi:MAG: YfhO family protein [Pyrinomonadaceae bacterium]
MPKTQPHARIDQATSSDQTMRARACVRAARKHALMVLGGYTLLYVLFFAPVLFSQRLLAPGDGIIYFLPTFAAPHALWDAALWGGFPAVGDVQLMLWYPPARLFALFGVHGYQPFVLTAYVLASSFTYGYVYTLTRARLAATISGCAYGLCAFMITHAGHAALIHTAAWLPLVVWSLALLQRARVRYGWFVVAVLSVAMAALAGHPQIFVYTLCLATLFVIVTGYSAPLGRWRYYGMSALVLILGIGLAALQLWPTAELTNLSWRAALDFTEFVAYELPVRQVPVLLFPFLYGGAPGAFYATPYFGAWPSSADGWGAGELSGYAGLLPLVLACIGVVANRRKPLVWFWAGIVVLALLLALGAATPLAWLTYHLPVVNKFRAPARYLFVFAFAVSILAGLGINALQTHAAARRCLRRTLVGAGCALLVCLVALKLFTGKINELALQRLGHTVSLNPLTNPALIVPLLIFVTASGALLYWHRQPQARVRIALLLAVLLVDLASFGWFYEWRYRAPYAAYLSAPAAAESYRATLAVTHQRLLPVRGGTGRVSELPPNLSQLWGFTSASGYGPLILTRTSRLLTMPPHGTVDESWRDPANQGLDLMAARYVLVPPDQVEPPTMRDERGLVWSTSELNHTIGPGCNAQTPATTQIDLPPATRATRLGLVGALACAVALPDGHEFAQVSTTDAAGATHVYSLRAGRDASEWAYDCADVRPTMQHGRAQVFRSYPAQRGAIKCEGHDYVAFVALAGAQEIKDVSLSWTGPPGSFALKKLTAIDDEARISTPINPVAGSLHDTIRWRYAGEIDASNSGYGVEVKAEDIGASRVYENLRARPRVWLVSEALRVNTDEAFAAVRASRLPDGRAFAPDRVALVEEPTPFAAQVTDPSSSARVRLLTDDVMEIATNANAPAFLVTSDIYYPGWRATIDGQFAHIYQTDYALRGVALPPGAHVVRFEFRPRSFHYGIGVSALSLLLLGGCVLWLKRGALWRAASAAAAQRAARRRTRAR